jgi:hypothetical protein
MQQWELVFHKQQERRTEIAEMNIMRLVARYRLYENKPSEEMR